MAKQQHILPKRQAAPSRLKDITPEPIDDWQERFGRALAEWHRQQKRYAHLNSKKD